MGTTLRPQFYTGLCEDSAPERAFGYTLYGHHACFLFCTAALREMLIRGGLQKIRTTGTLTGCPGERTGVARCEVRGPEDRCNTTRLLSRVPANTTSRMSI